MSFPAGTVATDGATEANGLSTLERKVKPMLKRVDHDGAGRFLCRIVDERAAELRQVCCLTYSNYTLVYLNVVIYPNIYPNGMRRVARQ